MAMAQNAPATVLHAAAAEVPARAPETPAQTASPPPALEKLPAVPTKISYTNGQLKIDAFNSTLAEVLTKVAALTGVNIEIPPGAQSERMPVVELGPGPARQVLASLLSDSTFDYLIQSSSVDPDKLQSVLLMPREKKTGGASAADHPARSPYVRASAQPEALAPDSPAPAPPEVAATEASALNSAPAAPPVDPSAPPPAQLDQSAMLPSVQPDPSAPARPGAMSPPQTLNSQSISQQLQQMYQQRMQMIQPAGQAIQPVAK